VDVEEVVTVLAGRGDFWVDGEHVELEADQSIVFPGGSHHGFTAIDERPLHIRAAFSGPTVPTVYDEDAGAVVEFGGREGEPLDATRTTRART
jgi:mannose-6-phosphate isomerase-like protein (cupin superfamily)